jgi:tetratricopeptide (TPR) repeat protein
VLPHARHPRHGTSPQLRLAGNALAVGGDLQGAVAKYEEALALGPARGRHMLLSNLSAAQLQLGDKEAALAAAQAAVECAPSGFHMVGLLGGGGVLRMWG